MKKYVIRIDDKYYTGKYKIQYCFPAKDGDSRMIINPVCGEKEFAKRYTYIFAAFAIWLMKDTSIALLYKPRIEKIN